MSATELQLRISAFGGFNKQDVLAYIETTNHAHAEREEALRRELAEANQARLQAEEAGAAAAVRENEQREEAAHLTAELEQCTRALEKSQTERETESARRAAMEAEVEPMRERLTKAEPLAEAYESVKERTAGIELEAHHRALAVQAAAEAQVKKTKLELDQWLYKVQVGYDRLRTDVDATISHASGELERVRKSLDGLTDEFAEHDAALEALLHTCGETIGAKAPEPLPLEGE